MHGSGISIWFFIGVLLAIYGFLICGYGIYEVVSGTHAQVAAVATARTSVVGRIDAGARRLLLLALQAHQGITCIISRTAVLGLINRPAHSDSANFVEEITWQRLSQ